MRWFPVPLGRPKDLLAAPVVAESLPGRAAGFSGGDPRPEVPGVLALLAARGDEPLPWTEDRDLLLAPWPAPGEETRWLLEHLRRLPPAAPVALYERDVPILANVVVRSPEEDPEASPAAGRRAWRSAFRHHGRGGAEGLVLLPARRLVHVLRGSFLAAGNPGPAGSLQNRRYLVHLLDHQRSLVLLATAAARPLRPRRRLLFLAPHFDDECLLFGSAIAAAVAAGCEVRLVWMTDGGAAGERRRREAAAAAADLGVTDRHVLGAPETRLGRRGPWTGRLRRLIEEFAPERIHLPWWGDGHVDHYETARVFAAARPRRGGPEEVALSSFWTALPGGQRLPWRPERDAALRRHASQLAEVDYLRAGRGLGRWLGGAEGPAERHLVLAAGEYARLFRASGAARRAYLRR